MAAIDPMMAQVYGIQKLAELIKEIEGYRDVLKKQAETGIKTNKGDKGNPGIRGLAIKGDKGNPGKDADPKVVAQIVREQIPHLKGEDGAPGKDADPEQVARIVLGRIKPPKDGASPDADMLIDAIVHRITDGNVLKPQHIAGLDELFKSAARKSGEGYVHGGGITRLTAGSNITITKLADGSYRITSTGGSGFSTLAATEAPNGNLKVFTFSTASAQPTYLVVDNVWMKAMSAGGTTNWTWNNGTKKATLTVSAQDDIWGVV